MTYKKTRLWVLLAAFAAAPAFAQNIAVVNGSPIPKSRADALIAQLAQQGQPDSPQLQQAVRDELVNREILMQEALREGIANRPEVKAQVAVAQQTVVLRAFIENYVKSHAPSDAEVKGRYDELVKQAAGQELHLHHILVEDEKTAKDLIAKIKGGASFEDLAKQYSKDPGSAKNGGDLEWSNPKAYVPPFAEASEHLKKGEITDTPVHTQFGWHIIRLDDTRPIAPPPFEQVKPQISQQIEQERLQAFEQQLRARAKIQ
ncbi:peptidylprolyl isomerase [Trinickia caryophylli]|uniref:peptidylprolyl isomerase n=1 Tax=Trinickia caryophylli TaxID=28094 RepID=A0A1X7H5R7_TRICW|nr:peptidylprolyl isomerase [Trinickia caryophylli]PMS09583.1 peptidylprolyl isomerase [Trinickia caryophylli]TRX17285.1 peptidylprolyl isomerase [Trinickia caryophylli]WQE11975.1 peptidylprolyl isomerase [Trinickia caryophylli]SMF79603.1 peptidyl-prolyl cis-trans isomerase C [Trinickia caryophylli]GLU35632.1 peptidylprolyl isomerase [Trinickia caryophylli]